MEFLSPAKSALRKMVERAQRLFDLLPVPPEGGDRPGLNDSPEKLSDKFIGLIVEAIAQTDARVDGAAVTVPTIAALRALDVELIPSGALIEALGYYAAGDGGGGQFWLDKSDTSTADDGGATIVLTSGARAKAIFSDTVNVLRFGADASAVSDSTSAMASAFAYAAATKRPAYLPASAVIIVDALTVSSGSVALIGENDPAALNSSQVGVRSVLRKKSGGTNAPLLTVSAGAQVQIRGVAFDGDRFNNGSMTQPLVLLDGTGTNYDKRSLERVSIRYAKADGLSIKSAEAALKEVHVFDCDGRGIYLRGQDAIWDHVLVGRNVGDGIYIDNAAPYPAGANRFENIDSFQNGGHGVYSVIPFNGSYRKIVCNNNLKSGWTVDSAAAGVSSGRLRWSDCEFVNNNYPDRPYYASRGSASSLVATTHASGSYSNFATTGPGYIFLSLWINCVFTLSENLHSTKPAYGFDWSCTGTGNGYTNTFIQCIGDSTRPLTALTRPSALFANAGVNGIGNGDTSTGQYSGSVLKDFFVGGSVVATGSLSGASGSVTGNFSAGGALTGASGSVVTTWNVGDGNQTGTSGTPTLSVTHNTTVPSFLQSIISGQPTLRFRNLGGSSFDISDATNGRVGLSLQMLSGSVEMVGGGISPGPARRLNFRSPDSANGTDMTGSDLYLYSGRGTGSGAGSGMIFSVPVAGVSGTGLQTWQTWLSANSASGIKVGLNDTGTAFKRLRHGRATLVGGTVTVSDALVSANTRISITVVTPGGTQGFLSAPSASRVASTSFVINSTSATETSVVDWIAIEP